MKKYNYHDQTAARIKTKNNTSNRAKAPKYIYSTNKDISKAS